MSMGKTKKVGTTGRFGTRYGTRARKRVREIEKTSRAQYKCPSCESRTMKRGSGIGIWECRFCGWKGAGGAWMPETISGRTAKRTTKRLSGQ